MVSLLLGNDKVLNVHPDDRTTRKPIIFFSSEHIYLQLDPGLKHHFPCSLDVRLKPIIIHHFGAMSVLLADITEWDMSSLFQPKFLWGVLKDAAQIHQMNSRRPITGGMWSDLEGWNEARGPDAISETFCKSHEVLRPAVSSLLLGTFHSSVRLISTLFISSSNSLTLSGLELHHPTARQAKIKFINLSEILSTFWGWRTFRDYENFFV